MPVIIRDINWEETDTSLVLHIPMKGAKASKLDVLSSDQYLKVGSNAEHESMFAFIWTIGLLSAVLLRSVSLRSCR